MKFNVYQILNIYETLQELSTMKMPFKLSLIVAKNLDKLEKEREFYIKQEQNFAEKFFEKEDNGQFVQPAEGQFKIKEGQEEECREARKELDSFESDIELRKIPESLLENLEFTPKQIKSLNDIIESEE